MTDKIWEKINHYCGWLPIGVLFGLIICATHVEIRDLDLWLHLASGKYISLQKTFIQHDIFSCIINGKPWSNHEWLFQVLVYNIFEKFGSNGLLPIQGSPGT